MAVKVFLTHTVASPLSADKAETVRQKVAATLDIPQADVVLLPPGVTAIVVEVADATPNEKTVTLTLPTPAPVQPVTSIEYKPRI